MSYSKSILTDKISEIISLFDDINKNYDEIVGYANMFRKSLPLYRYYHEVMINIINHEFGKVHKLSLRLEKLITVRKILKEDFSQKQYIQALSSTINGSVTFDEKIFNLLLSGAKVTVDDEDESLILMMINHGIWTDNNIKILRHYFNEKTNIRPEVCLLYIYQMLARSYSVTDGIYKDLCIYEKNEYRKGIRTFIGIVLLKYPYIDLNEALNKPFLRGSESMDLRIPFLNSYDSNIIDDLYVIHFVFGSKCPFFPTDLINTTSLRTFMKFRDTFKKYIDTITIIVNESYNKDLTKELMTYLM